MKFLLTVLIFLMLYPAVSFAENSESGMAENMLALPVDEAAQDPSFLAYRAALISAVAARDVEAIVALSSTDISLSFGGDGGHAELRYFLEVPTDKMAEEYKPEAPKMRQRNWQALETVLNLGGRFRDNRFLTPYTWTAEYPDEIDPYDVYFVVTADVPMYSADNMASAILAHLSYNVVALSEWDDDAALQVITLPDGQAGYIENKHLRALLDRRAIFEKREGEWQMTYFIAGD